MRWIAGQQIYQKPHNYSDTKHKCSQEWGVEELQKDQRPLSNQDPQWWMELSVASSR